MSGYNSPGLVDQHLHIDCSRRSYGLGRRRIGWLRQFDNTDSFKSLNVLIRLFITVLDANTQNRFAALFRILEHQVHFILRLNALIRGLRQRERGLNLHPDFKEVRIARISMSAELSARLDAASKLDRDPRFIAELESDGERQADTFLRRRAAGTLKWEV